jgi:hypothetical protein
MVPFAWPGGHGILTRFSSPGGEGMKTRFESDSESQPIVLTTRMPRLSGPRANVGGVRHVRARSDGGHG